MSDQNYVLAFSKFRYVWEETELKIPTTFESKEHRNEVASRTYYLKISLLVIPFFIPNNIKQIEDGLSKPATRAQTQQNSALISSKIPCEFRIQID